jgi:hypothetical protein
MPCSMASTTNWLVIAVATDQPTMRQSAGRLEIDGDQGTRVVAAIADNQQVQGRVDRYPARPEGARVT